MCPCDLRVSQLHRTTMRSCSHRFPSCLRSEGTKWAGVAGHPGLTPLWFSFTLDLSVVSSPASLQPPFKLQPVCCSWFPSAPLTRPHPPAHTLPRAVTSAATRAPCWGASTRCTTCGREPSRRVPAARSAARCRSCSAAGWTPCPPAKPPACRRTYSCPGVGTGPWQPHARGFLVGIKFSFLWAMKTRQPNQHLKVCWAPTLPPTGAALFTRPPRPLEPLFRVRSQSGAAAATGGAGVAAHGGAEPGRLGGVPRDPGGGAAGGPRGSDGERRAWKGMRE